MLRRALTFALSLLAACSQLPSISQRTEQADRLAHAAGWHSQDLDTPQFVLRSYQPEKPAKAQVLTVYIEGDGFAWVSPSAPSHSPTPVDPVALRLALRDSEPAAYLGRPCQFVEKSRQRNCRRHYWSGGRFAPEVIAATSSAIDLLMRQLGARQLVLIGYSGGGAVAALVAARRQDVVRLITIAANLDHQAWTSEHRLTPLDDSLNPADSWRTLIEVPQVHFVGGRDDNTGIPVASAYQDHFPEGRKPRVIVIPEFDHRCCWEVDWPGLRDRTR
jgi:hypothetical protein